MAVLAVWGVGAAEGKGRGGAGAGVYHGDHGDTEATEATEEDMSFFRGLAIVVIWVYPCFIKAL